MFQRAWFRSFAGVIVLALGCGDDGGTGGTETEDGSGTGSGSSTVTMTTAGTTMTTTNGTADGTGTTEAPPGTSSDGGDATAGSDDATAGTTAGTTGDGTAGSEGSTTGGSPGADYPSCMSDDDCEDPYTLCWPAMEFGTPVFCTVECETADTCPVPSTGTATPICEGPPDTNICVLDCTDAECPDGMTCVEVFNLMRCTREE